MAETREVRTEFTLEDKISAGLEKIAGAAEKTVHGVEKLSEKFNDFRRDTGMTTAALLGVGVGLGAIVEKMKETTAEFGRTQKGLASFYAGNLQWDKATGAVERYDRSLALSKGTTNELHELSSRFHIGLEEVADTYKKVNAAAGPLHLTQKQGMDLTVMSAAAVKRWGISGEQAATQMARILQTKTVRGFDEMSISLRNTLGNIHKLSEKQVFDKLQKAMKDNITIADKMSTGIGDSLFRIQNSVSGIFEDLAGPLFGKLATSFDGWAKDVSNFAEKNGRQIEEFANDLVEGFKTLEHVTSMILKHWKEIAAVWAGMKVGGYAKGIAGAFAGGGEGGGGAKNIRGGIAQMGAAAAVPLVGGAIASIMDYRATKADMAEKGAAIQHLYQMLGDVKAGVASGGEKAGIAAELRKIGISETKDYDEKFREYYASAKTTGTMESVRLRDQEFDELTGVLRKLVEKEGILNTTEAGPESQLDADKKRKFTGSPIMNFNGGIRIEQKFDDADADRVFIRFKEDLEQYGRRPTQATGVHADGL